MTPREIKLKWLATAHAGIEELWNQYVLQSNGKSKRESYKLVEKFHKARARHIDKCSRQGWAEIAKLPPDAE